MPVTVGAPTLVLVPTELELSRLNDHGGFPPGIAVVRTCGFGPVAAAARTSALLARLSPTRVVLVGIAGSYDPGALAVGTAVQFDEVAIEGIGVGEGERLLAPPALGFPQWPSPPRGAAIHDRLPLTPLRSSLPKAKLLLTTCAASDSPAQASQRRARFPEAAAEDMEAFGVALACALEDVPLAVVRGISNEVGDRDPKRWRIPSALCAARELVLASIAG